MRSQVLVCSSYLRDEQLPQGHGGVGPSVKLQSWTSDTEPVQLRWLLVAAEVPLDAAQGLDARLAAYNLAMQDANKFESNIRMQNNSFDFRFVYCQS